MLKKIISTLFGGQEDNSDLSNSDKSPNRKLHIGAISKDIINPTAYSVFCDVFLIGNNYFCI
ncbi:MAG: hypothetical protein VYB35_10030, partial [Verrucomicrobiota bacterium]|nr:hypothetical protein [Verrucomicrobiota bacterium]